MLCELLAFLRVAVLTSSKSLLHFKAKPAGQWTPWLNGNEPGKDGEAELLPSLQAVGVPL